MTVALGLVLAISIGLIIKLIKECTFKEKEIKDITASWSRRSTRFEKEKIELEEELKSFKQKNDDLRHTIKIRTERSIKAIDKKDIYEKALQHISETENIQFVVPAPRATFVAPYKIAQLALEEVK